MAAVEYLSCSRDLKREFFIKINKNIFCICKISTFEHLIFSNCLLTRKATQNLIKILLNLTFISNNFLLSTRNWCWFKQFYCVVNEKRKFSFFCLTKIQFSDFLLLLDSVMGMFCLFLFIFSFLSQFDEGVRDVYCCLMMRMMKKFDEIKIIF